MKANRSNDFERVIYPQKVPLSHRLSPYLLLSGAALFLLGVFIYLLGYVRIGPLQTFYQNIVLNQGIAWLLRTTPAKVALFVNNLSNYSIVIILAGLVLAFNGVMIGIQPLERYKDTLFIQPALIFLVLFTYYPVAELIRLSFTDTTLQNLFSREFSFVRFANFKWLFHGSGVVHVYLFRSLKLTGQFILWETLITTGVGLLLALLFYGHRAGRLANVLISIPRYIAITGCSVLFLYMLDAPKGVVNYLLSFLRIQGPDWLNETSATFMSVLILSAWRSLGYGILLYFAAMRRIPLEHYDAAKIEGADWGQCFRVITFPQLRPTIFYLLCNSVSSGAKVYQTFDVLIGDRRDGSAKVFPLWIYDLAFPDEQIYHAAAVSFMYLLVLAVVMLLTMQFTLRSINDQ